MNTFCLFFLPLTWALAEKTKAIAPFEMNSVVNKKAFFTGLAANGNETIATIPRENPPFRDILSGRGYSAEPVGMNARELLFVSQDKAYMSEDGSDTLVEYNLQGSLFKPTVVISGEKIFDIALADDKRLFVSTLTGSHVKGIKSTISEYKDGALTKLHEVDGHLNSITVSHDNKKIYGIFSSFTNGYYKGLIEISLDDKEKSPKVLAKNDNVSLGRPIVKCDKQGNIYVHWGESTIDVYNPQGKLYSITSGLNIESMAISNSQPQYLYVGGENFTSEERNHAVGRVEL
ncbi:hypothetical protein DSO57_1016460 [Entomophthora muscae]|uniref:Uncharacterized protein n=2 Tax=Entomophthora muscae TaxID=34485 RepID=A0ACC2U4B4_9FUNG|nr:hypothetical protein DSO57_1016458 [Entomophthora muscae]KAJ9081272.1 hypothetical protein DSO57_1016460 [Entomophthora muscae]